MDATRFDNLTRALQRLAPRRTALGVLGGGLAALLTRLRMEEIAAKKGKNKKKKPKLNAFGCVNVGGKCRGKDALCCSGICQGKKPKKGEKDKSRCVAHNVLDCPAGADSCGSQFVGCGINGTCYQTTGQASFCRQGAGGCAVCAKDADCEALGYGPDPACIVCPVSQCPQTGGTRCYAAF